MKNTVLPIKYKDHRTLSFSRTFGTAISMPLEFSFDKLKLLPDQNADGLGQACTAYTHHDIASNEDGLVYDDYLFTYKNTLNMMGAEFGQPCDVMLALKATTVFGVKNKSESVLDALTHRRGPYFIVEKEGDYFGGLISAMWVKQGCLSVATPWFPEFEQVNDNCTVPSPINWSDLSRVSWHDWEACGVILVNGVQHIVCKSWQGPHFGRTGYCYFNREQINKMLGTRGAGCFGQKHANPEDRYRVEMSLVETAISYARMIISKLLNQRATMPSISQPKPVLPQPQPKKDLLTDFCNAIASYEGGPGERNHRNNNPGNCKYSPIGYASIYGIVGRDRDNFAIFKDWDTGFLYLENLVKGKAEQSPQQTVGQFMARYAPTSDGNNPVAYAKYITGTIGVDYLTFTMGDLLT